MYKCIKHNCDGSLSGIIHEKTPFDVEPKPFEGIKGVLNIITIDENENGHQIAKINAADYEEWYKNFHKIKG